MTLATNSGPTALLECRSVAARAVQRGAGDSSGQDDPAPSSVALDEIPASGDRAVLLTEATERYQERAAGAQEVLTAATHSQAARQVVVDLQRGPETALPTPDAHYILTAIATPTRGDDAVERFAALAGESVDTDRGGGRGGALEYGSHAADEYLAHMRDDQTMQAVLRFARGNSGATVVVRTSALREDLPVVGEAQVVGTWSDTARRVAQRWRGLGEPFTAADVADVVDVSLRHVRRVLSELDEAGYLDREHTGPGRANVYDPVAQPGAGEVELPDRDDAVASSADSTDDPGRDGFSISYTWNVRVTPGEYDSRDGTPGRQGVIPGAPPAPRAAEAGPPDD